MRSAILPAAFHLVQQLRLPHSPSSPGAPSSVVQGGASSSRARVPGIAVKRSALIPSSPRNQRILFFTLFISWCCRPMPARGIQATPWHARLRRCLANVPQSGLPSTKSAKPGVRAASDLNRVEMGVRLTVFHFGKSTSALSDLCRTEDPLHQTNCAAFIWYHSARSSRVSIATLSRPLALDLGALKGWNIPSV